MSYKVTSFQDIEAEMLEEERREKKEEEARRRGEFVAPRTKKCAEGVKESSDVDSNTGAGESNKDGSEESNKDGLEPCRKKYKGSFLDIEAVMIGEEIREKKESSDADSNTGAGESNKGGSEESTITDSDGLVWHDVGKGK